MPPLLAEELSPQKALIFRITHRQNVPWILRNGLHCSSSEELDTNFVSIGNPDLIKKRPYRKVPIEPGGTLDDYVPFYFTPYSPMLYNIRTGWGGIPRRSHEEIVIFVSSLPILDQMSVRYVFTDRHAYLDSARFFSDHEDLRQVAWDLLQQRDFRRDPEDPKKFERYQAEALVHRFLPVNGLRGVACYTEGVKQAIDVDLDELGVDLKTLVRPTWYL